VLGGLAASVLTLWVTFVPCFAWIFLGAPHVERLHSAPRLKGALAAVTAAVVGVMLNLAIWFGLRVLFARVEEGPLSLDLPVLSSVQPLHLALALLAAGCVFWRRLGVLPTLGITAGAGLVLGFSLGAA
jgi:chromate transporter